MSRPFWAEWPLAALFTGRTCGPIAERCVMREKFELVLGIISAIYLIWIVGDLLYWMITGNTDPLANKFDHWLRGHRDYYFIGREGLVKKEQRPLRLRAAEVNWKDDAIIVKRMPFFIRAEVYGKGRDNWSVSIQEKRREEPRIFLQDKRARSIEESLVILRNHSSLQELGEALNRAREERDRAYGLNEEFRKRVAEQAERIAELEKELMVANDRRADWLAAVSALHCEITTDRQRYRSPAAGHIRECLDVIIGWAEQDKDKFPAINIDKTMAWKGRFPSRVS